MRIKELLVKGIKKPQRIPLYVQNRMQYINTVYIRKRVPFTHNEVVDGWGETGGGLPQYSARLYKEVKLFNETLGGYHARKSLEIGCGYGRLSPWISEHSDQHYAVEPESALINDARKLHPNIHFYQAKAQKLPFPQSHFDLCVTWTVLQHIPPNELGKAVAEMKRVCEPNAVMVLSEAIGEKDEKKYMRTWSHTLEEWQNLLSPWKLASHKEQKIEESLAGHMSCMRFERET